MSQSVGATANNTSKKVKAMLAGGLVLGVGAVVTLAAWTDQEWAQGIFSAGSFNIESSLTGTEDSFTDNVAEGDAATLAFDLTGAENLAPSDEVAAPFVLRLDDATTYDASVTLKEANATGANAANLTYGILPVDSPDACTAEATGDPLVPAGTPLGTLPEDVSFTLSSGADDQAGAPVTLCFQVVAGNSLQASKSTTATWEFLAVSQD